MGMVLLILSVLVGFFLGTYIIGNFLLLVFMELPGVFRSCFGESPQRSSLKELLHLLLETIGWFLLLLSLVFLVEKYLPGYQKIFLCGICVSFAFHLQTLIGLYRKRS